MLKERRKHIVTAVTLLVPANNSGAFSLAGKLFASICRDRCESHDVGANLCDKRKICLQLGTHEREREREEVKRNSCRRCGRKCHMIGIKSARAIWRAARRIKMGGGVKCRGHLGVFAQQRVMFLQLFLLLLRLTVK